MPHFIQAKLKTTLSLNMLSVVKLRVFWAKRKYN